MRSSRYLVILLYVLIFGSAQAEEGRYKYGEVWNSWTDSHRSAYLWGLRDGTKIGVTEFMVFDGSTTKEKFDSFLRESLVHNFPDINVVRNLMTEFYEDPANVYLDFGAIFNVCIAKIEGASPQTIENILARDRKHSYKMYMFRKTQDPKYLGPVVP